ncbi:POC1 centriolar protein homolog B-like isoform X2 [Daktulosphaira vitifoliae]|nr:POC1 centriolar protein homolog B-like isoform X2 [Daktulosphaira vitifoliae]
MVMYDWSRLDIKIFKTKYPGSGKVTNLSSNLFGNKISTCTNDGKIQLWGFKFSNFLIIKEIKGHFLPVQSVEFSYDNNKLVSCSNDKTFKIWDCQTLKFLASNIFHRNWVNTAKFFNNDRVVVSCSRDSYIQVYDCFSGKCVIKFNIGTDYAETLTLKTENSIAVGTAKGSVRLYDIRVPNVVQVFREHIGNKINCIHYQHNSPCLVTGSIDKTLNVYDTNEGRFLYSINHEDQIKTFDISLNDQYLATTSFASTNEITIWETKSINI